MTATPTTISQLPVQAGALAGTERLVVDLDGATIAASAITSGGAYRIVTVGTTDWVAIGAASNTDGVSFVATGVGAGSGTAVALLTRRVTAQQVADLVDVVNGQELEDLHDVSVASATTGQALRRGSDGVWRGHTYTAADVGAIAAYVFDQPTPATTWTINHNLGYRPSVELVNSGSQAIDGEVAHPSVNQTIVTLNPPTSGQARLV